MFKKTLSSLVLLIMLFMPIFGLNIKVPEDKAGDDINISLSDSRVIELWAGKEKKNWFERTFNIKIWAENNAKLGLKNNENTLINLLKVINSYLWMCFGIVSMGAAMYGGFELITGHGDQAAMKKARWAFMGVGIGLCIAMLSYAAVSIIVNLI